jgi:hypothetical protein
MFKAHAETLHGIVSHHRSNGTISSTARYFSSAAFVDTATSCRRSKNVVRLSLHLPVAYLTPCEHYGSPLILLTVEGPVVPLSTGLFGFVALRCYAEEFAFSLSTQAQDHVWDLAEYKRVEPTHCPNGATSGGAGC